MPTTNELSPISVIVLAHEQCDDLRRNLPDVLQQEYSGNFEVIVVDMNSTDDTKLLLEQMEKRYPHLHTIIIPGTVRNISPSRLALTLGMRAASYDCVALTTADCRPATSLWLQRLGECFARKENAQIVLGYTRSVGGKGWSGLRHRFFRTWQQIQNLSYARRHGGYRADGTNLCYRRSLFLEHRGFADDANLLMGATDIMVNRHSNGRNTEVCLHSESFMIQHLPPDRGRWHEERIFFMETRRHFRRTVLFRLRYFVAAGLAWFATLCATAGLLGGILFHNTTAAILSAVLWIAYNALCSYLFNRKVKALGERPFTFSYPLLVHLIPLWDTTAWLQWLFTKRQVFRKKFI